MILLLDNYDSFTWNLLHYVEQLTDEQIDVRRNDELELSQISNYSSIILSPGPGLPSEAGSMNEIIKKWSPTIPTLGICLGHQAIAETFGGSLTNLKKVNHGIQRELTIVEKEDRLFKGLPSNFTTGHYHSWIVDINSLPEELVITAVDHDQSIMAFSHKHYPISGVQFHPESIMTEYGLDIMKNWLQFCKQYPN